MNRNISFDQPFPRYEKRKRGSNSDSDEDDSYEKIQDRMFKRDYAKQFKENKDYLGKQYYATNKLISHKDWEDLDAEEGPKINYTGPLELQEGPELEANLNALENRGDLYKPKINKTTGQNVSKKGVWGGKTKKSRKSKKSKKVKKSRKTKKVKKSRKSKK